MLYSSIVGQSKIKDILTNSFVSKNIPHAWLFLGDQGAQNLGMAYQYSKTLLCDSSSNVYCGECESCHLFDSRTHPDLFDLRPRGKMRQMKQEDVSQLIKFLSLKSYRGGYKVTIIEDADRLSQSSANKLLKSLEEPPDKSVLILVCKNESDLLPTIVSRCVQLEFLPLIEADIVSYLEKQHDLPLDIQVLTRISKGHVGNLQKDKLDVILKNRELAYDIITDWASRGRIAVIDGAESILSYLDKEKKQMEKDVVSELKSLKDVLPKVRKDMEEKLFSNMVGILKQKLDAVLDNFTLFLRDIMIVKADLSEEHLINIDKLDLIKKSVSKIYNISQKIQFSEKMRIRMQGSVNQKLAVETFLLTIFS